MIKNLLDADEETPSEEQNTIQKEMDDKVDEEPIVIPQLVEEHPLFIENKELFEIPEDTTFFKKEPETPAEIIEQIPSDQNFIVENATPETVSDEILTAEISETETIATVENPIEINDDETALITINHDFKPPSKAETIRQSGLAWSAGVIFFGSIVFTMILGWFADLLLGTSPWGLVGGIVLGSIIGFIQFFRITSQIFKNK